MSNVTNAIATTTTNATIKVVINASYGGFGLSELATKWMAERGDKKAAAHLADKDNYWGDGEFYQYRCRHRHDALLVKCVETLGSAAASGMFAELKVITVNDDRYYISVDDGAEHLITPTTVPWVQV